MLQGILKVDQNARFTIEQILEHPYVNFWLIFGQMCADKPAAALCIRLGPLLARNSLCLFTVVDNVMRFSPAG
jgi:hypothetical protein